MSPILPFSIVLGVIFLVVLVGVVRSIRIVPSQSALVVERLGKYAVTHQAGLHLLIPFIDRVKYHHSLKEKAVDVPTQPCFTWDNIKVEVDGVLYYKVMDPVKASYGITNYEYATIQLAQTTMRSVIGKLELDKTFEERDEINTSIMHSIDEATNPWGVKITRYEIQNISVPEDILTAMEIQMRAERERRAAIARSQGEMESRINYSLGVMEAAVNQSEGEKERRVNEAEGQAAEITALARATAAGIHKIAEALEVEGGDAALALRISEKYIQELEKLGKPGTRVVLPMDLSEMSTVLEKARRLIQAGS
jgi:regulator of protease activity HflC (stomatin/prohibitin superfamily)